MFDSMSGGDKIVKIDSRGLELILTCLGDAY